MSKDIPIGKDSVEPGRLYRVRGYLHRIRRRPDTDRQSFTRQSGRTGRVTGTERWREKRNARVRSGKQKRRPWLRRFIDAIKAKGETR